MDDKTTSLEAMVRRALEAQIEMGTDEIILPERGSEPVASETQLEQPNMTTPDNSIESTTAVAEYASVDDHLKAICECQLCSLGKTRTKFVYGVGNPKADVMFIGEAPGAQEDLQGEPFVGRAGQLLDKILVAIGFTRDNVYIANILKCRPPKNRDPQPDEMELCFGYLREQVAIIQPRLICALGRIAAQALLQTKTPLGKLRGDWHEYEGVPLLVTYHPAALLRFPAYKKDTWEDVQRLKARYDELQAE
jgi:DNA polymerase